MLSYVTPTDCLRARESASAKLDVELPDLEAAWLHAHLCACADCAVYAREIGGMLCGTAGEQLGVGANRSKGRS